MHPSIIITDLNGSRRLSDEQLPLNVGTEQDAHIRLPEWEGTGSFAQISMLDDRCFVQPQNPNVTLKLNGVSLVTPKWFDDGDVLSIGDADIEFHDDGDEFEFEVFLSTEDSETVPPAELVHAASPAGEASLQAGTGNDAKSQAPDYILQTPADETGFASATVDPRVPVEAEPGAHLTGTDTGHDPDDAQIQSQPDPLDAAIPPLVARESPDVMEPLPSEALPASAPVTQLPVKRKGSWMVRACWLLLLLVIGYALLSSKVTVTTLPAGADVTMEPRWLAPGRAGRFFLIPGSYDFVAEAAGYEPGRGSFAIEFLERKTFSVELAEKPGQLDFQLPPDLAGEIWVDGERVARLDELPVALTKGPHEFRIVTDLYQEYAGSVDIIGRDELQILAPDLIAEWGSFAVATQPPGAEIYFGEQLLGTTPATVDVAAGEHQLELRLPGYRSIRKPVNSVAGEVEILPIIELPQLGASVEVNTNPAGAAVNSADKFLGATPLTIEAPLNEAMRLTIAKPGYATVVRNITVEKSEPVQLDISLSPLSGLVVVEASPVDALLFVDGELAGSATQEISLSAVEHEIEIRRDGYQAWTSRVTPTPGIPQRIDVSLLSDIEARLENLPARISSSLDQNLVLVTPGQFTLGSLTSTPGRRANEVIRSVSLERPFYIGTTEVTNREFQQFNPRHSSATEEYAELKGPDKPVVMLSWSEAAAYCNWLSDREGLDRAYIMVGGKLQLAEPANAGYRLPTEAEWAWVARYGGGLGERRFPWGMAMPPSENAGNYADASAINYFPNAILGYEDGNPLTANVGMFEPNVLGVFDLGGNVAEWINDYYSSATSSALQVDPTGPSQGQYHVIRGSSWRHSGVSDLRLAARDFGASPRVDVGFRLARYAPQIEVSEADE